MYEDETFLRYCAEKKTDFFTYYMCFTMESTHIKYYATFENNTFYF